MSATVRQLLDGDNNLVYPVTAAGAVYLNDGKYTVQSALDHLQAVNMKIVFKSSGEIEKTFTSGDKVSTVFNADNTITETTTASDGTVTQVKVTKFNEDGSIDIEVK